MSYFQPDVLRDFLLDRLRATQAGHEPTPDPYYFSIMSDWLEDHSFHRLDWVFPELRNGLPAGMNPLVYWAEYALLFLSDAESTWEVESEDADSIEGLVHLVDQEGEEVPLGYVVVETIAETQDYRTLHRIGERYALMDGDSQFELVPDGTVLPVHYINDMSLPGTEALFLSSAGIDYTTEVSTLEALISADEEQSSTLVTLLQFSSGWSHATTSYPDRFVSHQDPGAVNHCFVWNEDGTDQLLYLEDGELLEDPLPNEYYYDFSYLLEGVQSFIERYRSLAAFFAEPDYNPALITEDRQQLWNRWNDFFVPLLFSDHGVDGWDRLLQELPDYLTNRTLEQAQQGITEDALYYMHFLWHEHQDMFTDDSDPDEYGEELDPDEQEDVDSY